MESRIRDLSHDGRGIGTIDGKTVFVQGAYPGELVQVAINKEKKNYLEAKAIKILQPSPDRIESICPDFYHCNSCQYCDYSYQAQVQSKRKRLQANLKKFAKLEISDIKVQPMADYNNYRNHIQLRIKDGTIGYVDKENFSVFKPSNCLIWPEKTGQLIESLEKLPDLKKINLLGLRENYKKDLMLILVTKSQVSLDLQPIIQDLQDLGVSHIYQNINPRPAFHYGHKSILLYGQGAFEEEILGNKFILSPTSFFQVNRKQAENLYKKAIANLDLKKDDQVLELYSGIGTISVPLAQAAKTVLGIEYGKEAVKDAKKNAQLNGLKNMDFKAGKVENLLDQIPKDFNKVLLDPPRAGADKKVLEKILDLGPEKISYVSCDPATLARDLGILLASGKYSLEKVEIVDMFPLTSHLESVVLLESEKTV
ncbi:MAG: 23S rRNA (uracil(1939)-C(5))-methyltransferase RlmD [Bacillota bacterium]|nr:23S rRNA (uracil(1939)-C(5))-methyltransferase RlmD [Bacillota bacterium]